MRRALIIHALRGYSQNPWARLAARNPLGALEPKTHRTVYGCILTQPQALGRVTSRVRPVAGKRNAWYQAGI